MLLVQKLKQKMLEPIAEHNTHQILTEGALLTPTVYEIFLISHKCILKQPRTQGPCI